MCLLLYSLTWHNMLCNNDMLLCRPWTPSHLLNWLSIRIPKVCELMCCVPHVTVSFLPVGKYHCPVTFKVFNENSHIVAVRTTGNVYSYEVSTVRMGCCLKPLTGNCMYHRQWNVSMWSHVISEIYWLKSHLHEEMWSLCRTPLTWRSLMSLSSITSNTTLPLMRKVWKTQL